jgi:hypothetical protein
MSPDDSIASDSTDSTSEDDGRVNPSDLLDSLDPHQGVVPRIVAEQFSVTEDRAESMLKTLESRGDLLVVREGSGTPVWVRPGPD